MNEQTVSDLVCPCCLSRNIACSPLELLTVPRQRRNQAGDLLEGLLHCRRCRTEYPIIAGVLVAVPAVASYLRLHFSSIVAQAAQVECMSEEMLSYLCSKGYQNGKLDCREYYDSPRKISTYLCGGYDSLKEVTKRQDSLSHWLRERYEPFYDVMEQLCEEAAVFDKERRRAIDVACYVGGFSNRIGVRFDTFYGVDASFGGVLCSRRLHFGSPLPMDQYTLFESGNHRVDRLVQCRGKIQGDFIVGQCEALPFRGDSFDFISSLNLLELVPGPEQVLREVRRLSKVGSFILHASPYYWEEDEAGVERWLEGTKPGGSEEAVRTSLATLGISIVKERRSVPWVLRYNSRAHMTFLVDSVLGFVESQRNST